jgi:hypothetical protein
MERLRPTVGVEGIETTRQILLKEKNKTPRR